MPRKARSKSASGIYHVILRGNNKNIIFEDEVDFKMFIKILRECQEKDNFKIHAICLMTNHVHMLLEEKDVPLDKIMHRFEVKFVHWYNNRYERIGGIYQGRYISEPVETDEYFLTVVRYIHQNPLKAMLENSVGEYKWTSYLSYMYGKGKMITTEKYLSYFRTHEDALYFLKTPAHDKCMEYIAYANLTDQELEIEMRDLTGIQSPKEMQRMSLDQRREYLAKISCLKLSLRRISRLTGLSRTSLERCL